MPLAPVGTMALPETADDQLTLVSAAGMMSPILAAMAVLGPAFVTVTV